MKALFKLATTSLLILMSFATWAVEYTFPTDGWYQLQDPATFREVCTTSSAVCDIPAGEYVLINHSLPQTDSNHRTSIAIGSSNSGSNPEPNTQYRIESTMVEQSCLNGFPSKPFATDDQPCVAYCPQGYGVTGGSCKATRSRDTFVDERDGEIRARFVDLRVPTNGALYDGGYACELEKNADFNPNMLWLIGNNNTNTEIVAQAICSTVVTE